MSRIGLVLLAHFSVVPVSSSSEADISQASYSTEADISLLVTLALTDAVKLAKYATGLNFEVRHEVSLFSQRPDHLVVVDLLTAAPLVAVEDEKPWGKATSVEELGCVLSQVFDYASTIRAFSNVTPFVVLSTFESSLMFWFDEPNRSQARPNLISLEKPRRTKKHRQPLP